jgi:superkiller protein 3
VGRSYEEVRRKACNGDLADALERIDGCGADPELIVLMKACLSSEATDRPKDAQAVADGLMAYLNGVQERLRQAELAEAEAKAKAVEEAKRRRLTLALAATVLLALTLAGGGGLWYQRQVAARQEEAARREAELREAVRAGLDKVTDLRQRAHWGEARAVVEQVRQRLGPSGPEDLRCQVEQADADLALVDRLDAARLKAAVWVGDHFDHASAVREYAAAFRDAGLGDETESAEVVAQRIRASAVREQLVTAVNDEWVWQVSTQKRLAWVLAVARAADPDPWRNRLRDAEVRKDRAALERLAREAKVGELSPQIVTALGALLAESGADPVPLLTAAQRRNPSDFWLNFRLAQVLCHARRWDEAIGYYRAALALRPTAMAVCNNLGFALWHGGCVDEGMAEFKRAIEIDPGFVFTHINLGAILCDVKHDYDGAIACFRKAIELDPKDALYAYHNLGHALYCKGRVDEAVAEYKKAIELDPRFANAHYGLGTILYAVKHDYDGAIACFRKAIEFESLSGSTLGRPGIAGMAHHNLGLALRGKDRGDEAIAEFRKAIEINPRDGGAHNDLGLALMDKGRVDEAIACYKKAIDLDPRDDKAHINLGTALAREGHVDEAIAECKKAIEIDPNYALAHDRLGAILCDGKRDFDGAIACFRKAIELDPKFAEAHNNLGVALENKGQQDEAIACYRQAVELDPTNARTRYVLARALANKGQFDEAIACYRQAIELDPKNAAVHVTLGNTLYTRGRLDEAITCYRQAIELDSKNAMAHNNLGLALKDRGQVDEAIVYFRQAIELVPKDARAHNCLGAILCDEKRDYEAAVACFKKAIALDPDFAEAHCDLGHAFRNQGRFAEALAAYQRGHELGMKQRGWRYPSAMWVQKARRMAALEAKLPAFLKGEFQPEGAERLGLIGVCHAKRLNHAVTRLYADAFAADPKLANDPKSYPRYNAACAAALAAIGQGEDAARLDVKDKIRLRKQALDWLRADLGLRSKQLESGQLADRKAVQDGLRHWLQDSDLTGLRDVAALAKLPPGERDAWEKLWSDVAGLLKQAGGSMK